MPKYRCLTLQEAVTRIAEDSDVEEADILILPPNDEMAASDIEEIDEENLESIEPGEVCGELDLDIQKVANVESEGSDQLVESDSDSELLSNYQSAQPAKKRKWIKSTPKWMKRDDFLTPMPEASPEKLADLRTDLIDKSPFDLFMQIFGDDYVDHLASMTNIYAQQKLANIDTNGDELIRFFGILLLSGYHQLPKESHYWSTAEDLSNNIVPKIMSRKRFRDLKTYFHIVDNLNLQPGKVAKIEPFYDHLTAQFVKVGGVFSENLSIDESMVPYYGHHSCKMFIRGKPIRFGYKVWMLCCPAGYPFSMQIYTGAKEKDGPQYNVPLGTRVVLDLISVVENPNHHSLFFDNYFTSYDLMIDLKAKGFRAVGTVRENRTSKCPLVSSKELAKKPRGEYDYRGDGNVVCVRWNDNSVVTVMSNWMQPKPLQNANRYSVKQKQKIIIKQPKLIGAYNQSMGGVDLLDRLLGSYRPKLRSKKWWWNLFANGLNMAVVAAWRLQCHLLGKQALSHLDFRREVALVAMKVGLEGYRSRKGGPTASIPSAITASANTSHYLSSTSQGRCIVCSKNTKKWCQFCGKRLHEKCFPDFHSR